MNKTLNRVEAFSDGVIAIIITIMVLNIPLPNTFGLAEVMQMLGAVLVFFVSFFVVAAQWNKHRVMLNMATTISNKLIWRNILYLCVLALIPIFTKWVIQNPDEVVPAIGYDIVFLLVNISYQMTWDCVIRQPGNEAFYARMQNIRFENKFFGVLRFVIMGAVIIGIFVLSFFNPRISLIFFIGFPVVTSLFNLVFESERNFEQVQEVRKQ